MHFIIQGLAGARKLRGEITINGAKNSALKAMAASVLFDGPVTLENIPDTADIETMSDILKKLGAKIDRKDRPVDPSSNRSKIIIDSSHISSTDINQNLAGSMRASVVLTGPLLARYGRVTFPAPGGCVIGARPIDLFLSAYEQIGAKIDEKDFVYNIHTNDGLEATEIAFSKISVGATETLMMTAVLLKGKTVLKNCAREPEIVNVAEWLNICGADIQGAGTSTITINGTSGRLLSPKVPFVTIPDRIEAGSFLILGASCAQELTIDGCEPRHLKSLTDILQKSGVSLEIGDDYIKIVNDINKTDFSLKAVPNIETLEYPGFPTDLQAPLAVLMTQADGISRIKENIFEGRFKYVEDLVLMGADINTINPHEIVIKGPKSLRSLQKDQHLNAYDIRAGFAIVLAGLIAEGQSVIDNVHLIDRGYERLEERLKMLGADIERR